MKLGSVLLIAVFMFCFVFFIDAGRGIMLICARFDFTHNTAEIKSVSTFVPNL